MDEQVSIDFKVLGTKLKQKRKHLGLTQEKIAEYLQLEESYYSRIERGERELSIETLVKLAHFYDLSLDWLLLDSTLKTENKLLVEIDAIFRDKNPSESTFLLTLLKINSENIKRLLP
jgi:transcriptional regulator with XRE-family HTH domain